MIHEGVRMALGGLDHTRPYHPYKAVHDAGKAKATLAKDPKGIKRSQVLENLSSLRGLKTKALKSSLKFKVFYK
ncbi:hypothetical protein F2Q69_00058928 [Brassica cretica]|uniref:Uncharacterized protein n=1 Tax=Brassica cretica TaxID=69181 RepID=A0A8S9RK20_BRACR|nr:hypothetical protein F2Q69_00058928 [Brassica cretica]